MEVFGVASIYGVEGTVDVPAYSQVESIEGEHTAEVEEFKNGLNQMLGFHKSDERFTVNVTLVAKAATLANAKTALAHPSCPVKVTLAGFVDSGDTGKLNGEYIYKGGGQRTVVRGQAGYRISLTRYNDLPAGVTHTTLTTLVSP